MQGRIWREESLHLKPMKLTLFTMISYYSENSIRDIRPFLSIVLPHQCHEVYFISLTVVNRNDETWLPNIT